VCIMQAWMAGKQLMRYTYTPTEQKSATTPKPPRILAMDATAVSQMGTVCFGRLI